MQIVGHEFLELAKGLYISEDKKGIIIDLYDFTDTKQKTPKEQIANALFDNLKSNIQNIGSEVECVIVRTGSTQDKDPWYFERIELDSTLICEIFPKINKLILPDELYTNGDLANKANSMDAFYFSNLAYKEEQNGNLEKAEYYFKWEAEVDFYWGNKHYGDFLVDQGRYKEAEECFLKIAGRNDISGDGNAHYAHLLLDTERYDEAIEYYEYVLRQSDTSPREGICVRMETLFYESDAPIWKKLGTFYFNSLMSYYTGIAEGFIEDILLARFESDNDEISSDAKKRLFTLYSKGKFLIPGLFSPYVVDLYDLIDLEKAKKYSPSSNSGDLEDPDNPFWLELDTGEFNNALGEIGINDIYKVEKMLQNRAKSDNDEIKKGAMLALLKMYYEGYHYVGSEYCECIGGYEMKDFDKVCEASKVFVEFPDTLDEIDCDLTYFNYVMYYIEKEHTDNENEFKNRFIDGIIKYAEENSENIDDVINGIQENLEYWYDGRDDKYPFYLGYIPKGCTFVPTMSFFYSWSECNTELTSIVIPNTIKEIQDNAFYNCCNLTSVTLPDTLETIRADAFGNTGITSIIIPEGITEIDEYTFKGCGKLEYVKLPTSLKIIGADAFYGCSSLTSIELPENLEKIEMGAFFGTGITQLKIPKSVSSINSEAFYSFASGYDDDSVPAPIECFDVDDDNENYCSFNGNLYTKDMKTLVLYACKKHEETFKIPDEVTKIGSFAFCNCTSLTDVIIPNGVTEIGSNAFYKCTSLTSIIIPKSVTKIGHDAFRECTSLTDVVIPNGVTEIGSYAFERCSSLTSIIIPESVTKIDYGAFYRCTSLKSVIIPESVTKIYGNAFRDCISLTNIIIPKSVTEIESYAFERCTSLTSIIIPNGVTKIGSNAFDNCTSLTSVIIPESVTKIGSSAFFKCTSLTSIIIPDGVTKIDSYAFYNCTSLTDIIIPEGVTEIGSRAFFDCTSLTSVKMPDGVTKIDSNAFSNCTSLTSVIIPESVTKIDDDAFCNCTSLTDVIIPENVTEIGSNAFCNCTSLTSIIIPDGVTEIYSYAFCNCTSLTSVIISESVTKIGSSAFSDCTSLTDIIIPENVTEIGSYAFSGCTSLTDVIIPENVTEIGPFAFQGCTSLTDVIIPENVTETGHFVFQNCSSLKTIYCEAESKPQDWDEDWVSDCNAEVIGGYKK